MTRYYAIHYAPDGKACPYHLSGEYSPAEWEFDGIEAKPLEIRTTKPYYLYLPKSAVQKLDFDYYDRAPNLVSVRFLEVCKRLNVKFNTVPLNIMSKSGQPVNQLYYIFFAGDNISLLDQDRSAYTVEHVTETGDVMIDRLFPPNPVYNRIDRFSCKQMETPAMFFCIEIMRLVCTESFQKYANEAGLKGLRFVSIDENYVYDPWCDFQEGS